MIFPRAPLAFLPSPSERRRRKEGRHKSPIPRYLFRRTHAAPRARAMLSTRVQQTGRGERCRTDQRGKGSGGDETAEQIYSCPQSHCVCSMDRSAADPHRAERDCLTKKGEHSSSPSPHSHPDTPVLAHSGAHLQTPEPLGPSPPQVQHLPQPVQPPPPEPCRHVVQHFGARPPAAAAAGDTGSARVSAPVVVPLEARQLPVVDYAVAFAPGGGAGEAVGGAPCLRGGRGKGMAKGRAWLGGPGGERMRLRCLCGCGWVRGGVNWLV